MRRVKIYSTLVGRSNAWKRNMPKETQVEFGSAATLSYVRDLVVEQFGERALVIVNEKTLESDKLTYPEFYSAGWFVSEGEDPLELVVVDHGKTMEAATNAMMESVKLVNWDLLAARI